MKCLSKLKNNFSYYLSLFFIVSMGAWVLEIMYSLVIRSKLVNPGVLSGPWCPIYGITCIILNVFTNKDDLLMLNFIKVFLSAAIIEYLASFLSEKLFNHIIWNYSKFPWNINGRICLHMTILFTLMGLIFTYMIEPHICKKYIINKKWLNYISYVLVFLFVLDILF